MSILIRGMEMPTSCAKCKLFGEYGCPFIGAVGYALTRGERNEDCPLVPAADVRPVVHGRWIISRTDRAWNGAEYPTHCKCNQCGREIPYLDRDAYCPNCGALMDKDGD